MNNIFKFLIILFVSSSIIFYVLYKVSFIEVKEIFLKANGWYLLAIFALIVIGVFVRSLKWKILLNAQDINASYIYTTKLYFIGMFFNTFMPGGVGGDVVKGYKLGKSSTKMAVAYSSIIVDRFFGLLSLLSLGATGLVVLLID